MRRSYLRGGVQGAIVQAKLSTRRTGRIRVGAVLVEPASARIVVAGFRGEHPHAHAEQVVIEKALADEVDVARLVLFTTHEPCVQRRSGATPCVELIVRSGIRTVYIGVCDPNHHYSGEGVRRLSSEGIVVHGFPASYRGELENLGPAPHAWV